MTDTSSSNVHGAPARVTAEQPIRAPLVGGIPWANHAAHPAVTGPIGADQHVRPVPQKVVDAAGGPTIRRQ
jgi:hypothetical protein